jgi:hypothetical protein
MAGTDPMAVQQPSGSLTPMPQTPRLSRLIPGSSRAAVEQPMSESNLAVAASSPADRAALAVARETGENRAIAAPLDRRAVRMAQPHT